ncbi:uncharacterized protein JCM15063_004746 [Sporobolomyces koalae]|uniref:uncharacterized protein n=1 Tax=Sporobolomyces koalae TaxID=500713 RepID=UPI003172BD6D
MMHSTNLCTLSLLALAASTVSYALPTAVRTHPEPALAAEFEDILARSPRDLAPAYELVERDQDEQYTAPKPLRINIAYFPAIEQPTEGSTWTAGQQLTVGWNNTKPDYAPNQIHNYAQLLLGFRNPDDPSSGLNLDIDRPLANVSLYGTEDPISVQLPADLPTRSTYLLVLGSTANMSPLFMITAIDAEQSESSVASSSSKALATTTRAIVAAPTSTHSSSSSLTSEGPDDQSSSSAGEAASSSPSSSSHGAQATSTSEQSESESPAASASPLVVVASAASSSAPGSTSTHNSVTLATASGGAIAASSSTPTSGASGSLVSSSSVMLIAALIIISPQQRFVARIVAAFVGILVLKWIFWDSTPRTRAGEIAHPAILERITLGSPLSGQSLDTRKYSFLQSRINRDETHDVFDNDIYAGMSDFWTRFQKPFMTGSETMHLDEQVVRGAIDELLGFNGWAAAACSSLTRPFGLAKKEDDWSDLARPGALYYFALVVHGADHFLIDQLAVIVQLSKRLGPNSVFVSLVDYASTDSTPFICDMAEAIMLLLGISYRIRQVDPMTADPTASYYPLEEAYTRNLALEPLQELWERRKVKFERVIWLKGFTCPNDILETIRVSMVNKASMVCSMDWKEHNGFFIYNDRWRTRDMDGNLFRGSKSTSPIDEAPPRDSIGGARYTLHLPFQVFCCESGTHIVDPHKSYYHGITYQSSVEGVFNTSAVSDGKTPRWSEGPCMDSAQLHFCRDMWMVAFRDGIKQEAKRLSREEKSGKSRQHDPFMDELIQATLASYQPTSNTKVGYPNSGDYLADETGAAPGGGPGMDNDIGKARKGEAKGANPAAAKGAAQGGAQADAAATEEQDDVEEEEDLGDEEEGGAGDNPNVPKEVYDDQDGGKGRPIDLAVKIEDESDVGVPQDAAQVGRGAQKLPPVAEDKNEKAAPKAQGKDAAGKAAKEPIPAADGPGKLEWHAVKPDGPLAGKPDAGPAAWHKVDAEADVAEVQEVAAEGWHKVEQQRLAKRGFFSSSSNADKEDASVHHLEKRRPRSLPNKAFPNAIARILVNPRCVTTYAGVSHTQLALDLFGEGEDREPTKREGGKYELDDWRTAPESFVCQEMRTTGGRVAPKQQRRTGFQQARLLLNGWRPT